MNKVLMSLLFSAFMLTGLSFAQTPSPAADAPASTTAPSTAPAVAPASASPVHHMHHPDIHKAMRKLRGAKLDLQKATHDYGGHKEKAIAAIDEALAELQAALDYSKTQ